jgi:hypothetical protein
LNPFAINCKRATSIALSAEPPNETDLLYCIRSLVL